MESLKKNVRVCIVGCLHGMFNEIYDVVKQDEQTTGKKCDFLLCAGDFQVKIYLKLDIKNN